jgi:hypothetical protein
VHLALGQKTVLCVGGRSGNIANYRDVVERVDGRFAHHDGGLEDNASELDASPAAADLVICQTGCISHNAYSRVQDFGERTGKQCVYLVRAPVFRHWSASCKHSVHQPLRVYFLKNRSRDFFDRLGGGGEPADAGAPHHGLGLTHFHAAVFK